MKLTLWTIFLAIIPFSSNAANNPFTIERNDAVVALSTQIVTIEKMKLACSKKGTDFKESTLDAKIKEWQNKNEVFLQVQSAYIHGLLDTIKKTDSELAAQNTKNSLLKSSNDNAATIADKFFEGKKAKDACKNYFELLTSGKFDIKLGFPQYDTLKEMVESVGLQSKIK